jgi:hypothetical protein
MAAARSTDGTSDRAGTYPPLTEAHFPTYYKTIRIVLILTSDASGRTNMSDKRCRPASTSKRGIHDDHHQ